MSRLNLKTFFPILTAFLLIVAVACGSDEAEAPAPAQSTTQSTSGSSSGAASTPVPAAAAATEVPAATGGDAKYGGNVRMSAYADTKDWDPLGSASLSSIQSYSQLYNQLVQFSTGADTTEVVGDLADSWDVSNGGSTFTFH